MKKFTGLFSLLLAIVLLSSCDKDFVRGHGNTISQSRTLPAFSAVEITGNRNAEIIHSNESKVELTGYENLLNILEAKVVNGELHFEYPYHQVVRNDNIRVKIYTPTFTQTRLVGNAEEKVGFGFDAAEFKADLSGNGNLRFSPNHFNKLVIQTSGNAKVYAEPVIAKFADVNVSGNANIEVRATDKIKIRVSGSGDVHYWGNPAEVDVVISGNGHATKH